MAIKAALFFINLMEDRVEKEALLLRIQEKDDNLKRAHRFSPMLDYFSNKRLYVRFAI